MYVTTEAADPTTQNSILKNCCNFSAFLTMQSKKLLEKIGQSCSQLW